ncbi:hypothetical protein ZEAMMB73_Zm00001d004405 [Zea mays]|uniref:Uncharacterized protein n=1 Tax=Zea mays TaxID=4577 RepID=A0A1D6EF82_MAIZE|nr:hypothetical protein ZEAMMB73_Zm00001d004405 [Zea mays]
MNTKKNVVLCCLLFVLVLHADHALAKCGYTTPLIPFCKAWMCKAECWTEAKLTGGKVTQQKCMRGGIKGWCYCEFCI